MSDRELLPCPWCGGAVDDVVTQGSTFRWRVVQGCCTNGPEVRYNTFSPDIEAAELDARNRAIKAWNTRAALAGDRGAGHADQA